MRGRFIAGALICLSVSGNFAEALGESTRLIMRTKEKDAEFHQLLKWPTCAPSMKFIVLTNNPTLYQGERIRLQQLIGGLRAVTKLNCREMQQFELFGFLGKEVVFKGHVAASRDWKLAGTAVSASAKSGSGGSDGASDQNKRQPRTPRAKAMADKDFFAALSRPSVRPGVRTDPAKGPPPVATPPSPPPRRTDAPKTPRQNAALPNGQSRQQVSPVLAPAVDGQRQRDIYAYRKLGKNLLQLLDMSEDEITAACSGGQRFKDAPASDPARKLFDRLCVAFSHVAGSDAGSRFPRSGATDRLGGRE